MVRRIRTAWRKSGSSERICALDPLWGWHDGAGMLAVPCESVRTRFKFLVASLDRTMPAQGRNKGLLTLFFLDCRNSWLLRHAVWVGRGLRPLGSGGFHWTPVEGRYAGQADLRRGLDVRAETVTGQGGKRSLLFSAARDGAVAGSFPPRGSGCPSPFARSSRSVCARPCE